MPKLTPKDLALHLNSTVFCRLAPSPIHGVGVFAIRNIEAGQALFVGSQQKVLDLKHDKMITLGVHPAIIDIILDRHQMPPRSSNGLFRHPNDEADMVCFMNHSSNPNTTFMGYHAATDIKAGEEITKDYGPTETLNSRLAAAITQNLTSSSG